MSFVVHLVMDRMVDIKCCYGHDLDIYGKYEFYTLIQKYIYISTYLL